MYRKCDVHGLKPPDQTWCDDLDGALNNNAELCNLLYEHIEEPMWQILDILQDFGDTPPQLFFVDEGFYV